MRHLVKTLLGFAVLLTPAVAPAATIVGGDTRVAFGAAITGLEASLLGSASLVGGAPGLTVNFPITGGTLDAALAGAIRHDGSGISLSNGTNTLALSNFVIDTTAGILFGDAALNGTLVGTALDLFSFDLSTVTVPQLTDLDNPLLALTIRPTASGALTAAFGLGETAGATLGLAATAPQLAAVPEPGSWAMLVIGFGLVGGSIRIRQARTYGSVTA
ncbi:PEPxxWA-CTERM sorting domain-containing protein [Sandarakinorhabdus sp. DWP1-3-1]|uniref:PEPxxWA-CTERM sorting domain-containing protein n=1 Tax=Sandarakinorhabdus sp. DWP1-3-1 TaxID=2804627 RepID=UPI003CF5A70D